MDAGWVKVMKEYRIPKKAKVEDAKADNAAKTDGASAAPQDSGELFWLFCLLCFMSHFRSVFKCLH